MSDGSLEREIDALLRRSAAASRRLSATEPGALVGAWSGLVDELTDESSPLRARLQPRLLAASGLSPEGLQAGLEAAVGGLATPDALALLEGCLEQRGPASGGTPQRPPVLTVLAANIPGLALQTLLPALARDRGVLLKPSAREAGATEDVLERLGELLPPARGAFATVHWPSASVAPEAVAEARADAADAELPAAAGRRCDPWIVYGDAATLAAYRSLARRLRSAGHRAAGHRAAGHRAALRLVLQGPKTSVAILGGSRIDADILLGLARDVALFDQRGCLSVHSILTDQDPTEIARGLARSLRAVARELPVGPGALEAAAALREHLALAEMEGLPVEGDPRWGAVVIDADGEPAPGPGLRTVRVHRVTEIGNAARRLEALAGRIQGVALAVPPTVSETLATELRRLGISRLAPPGRLQQVDARWANGGVDLFELLR